MHAKVFQITKQRVDNENTLNENTLTKGDGSFYDYCAEITPEFRKEMIVILVNEILPKGMFTLLDNDEIAYNGGADEWKKQWVTADCNIGWRLSVHHGRPCCVFCVSAYLRPPKVP